MIVEWLGTTYSIDSVETALANIRYDVTFKLIHSGSCVRDPLLKSGGGEGWQVSFRLRHLTRG